MRHWASRLSAFRLVKECAGDPITVWYLPSDPHTNVAGDTHEMLRSDLTGIPIVAAVIPLFLVLVFWLRSWVRQKQG